MYIINGHGIVCGHCGVQQWFDSTEGKISEPNHSPNCCGKPRPEEPKSLKQIVMDLQQGAYSGNVTTEQGIKMITDHFFSTSRVEELADYLRQEFKFEQMGYDDAAKASVNFLKGEL